MPKRFRDVGLRSNPDFLLGDRTSASAECRHWPGRAVRWSSCAILLSHAFEAAATTCEHVTLLLPCARARMGRHSRCGRMWSHGRFEADRIMGVRAFRRVRLKLEAPLDFNNAPHDAWPVRRPRDLPPLRTPVYVVGTGMCPPGSRTCGRAIRQAPTTILC